MNWYVLCTKPRHEVKTAHALKQLGFEVYCPIKTEVRQWSDRKKKVRSPLFSKYIFVRTDEQNRNRVFQAAGILNFLFWLKKPAVVPEQEINSLRSYLEDNAVDAKEIHCFKSGDSVALKHGFFKGQKAEIKKINNQRVELILPVLGYRLIARTRDLMA